MIGITKGPNKKGKEKEVETEEEKEDNRGNEQAHLESPIQKRQGRQRSLSPIWNLSLDVREIHQGPAESSRQQSNNVEIMEMLKVMRQEMQERDRQLKIQLQLRYEYMDAELKRTDRNLDDALKERDEEWRVS